jgi:DNA polymerase-3 subunit beta
MRGIGEVARASGLSVSALRFYDGAGVLVPAAVDPATGYRRYADEQIRAARLIAGLRRVGMPVAEIARAVRNPAHVREIVALHRQRLADGYADARRELSRLELMLDLEERTVTHVTLPACDFAAALAAVRFAASTAPDLPALNGVLVETTEDALLVMATDRYRLASARVPARVEGSPARVVLPMSFVAAIEAAGAGPVVLELTDNLVRLGALEAVPVDADYPDVRRMLERPGTDRRAVDVDVAALRDAIAGAPLIHREHEGHPYEILVLGVDPAGSLRVAAESDWAADADAHVAVRREFLLEALDAGGAGQMLLELDGPIHPLLVRGTSERYSLLMPLRY